MVTQVSSQWAPVVHRSTATRNRKWSVRSLALCLVVSGLTAASAVDAQTHLVAGTSTPFKLSRTPGGNFLLAESGTGQGDGRLTLVTVWGGRLNLLSGLPSGITFEGAPAGPQGVAHSHRTVFVTLGAGELIGDTDPPRQFLNPDGVSSPLFTSVLRARFYPVPDGIREGFTLGAVDLRLLADGREVVLENDSGERVEILLLADIRDSEPDPVLQVRNSNPFAAELAGSLTQQDLVDLGAAHLTLPGANFLARLDPASTLGKKLEERSTLYVVDSGMNTIDAVDVATGRRRVLARIPRIANPLFPNLGGPMIDSVPTGIHLRGDGTLLVSLLTGFPFPPATAQVLRLDPATGSFTPLITGLRTVTDVLELNGAIYVLEFSTDFLANAPGRILRFSAPNAAPTVVVSGLISPAGFEYEPMRNELLVSEAFTGRVVRVPLGG